MTEKTKGADITNSQAEETEDELPAFLRTKDRASATVPYFLTSSRENIDVHLGESLSDAIARPSR